MELPVPKDQLVLQELPDLKVQQVPTEKQLPMEPLIQVRVLEWMVIFTSIPQRIPYLGQKLVGLGHQEFPWLDLREQRVRLEPQVLLVPKVRQELQVLKVQQELMVQMEPQELKVQQVLQARQVLHLQEQGLLPSAGGRYKLLLRLRET
jgi:hypothetical protein